MRSSCAILQLWLRKLQTTTRNSGSRDVTRRLSAVVEAPSSSLQQPLTDRGAQTARSCDQTGLKIGKYINLFFFFIYRLDIQYTWCRKCTQSGSQYAAQASLIFNWSDIQSELFLQSSTPVGRSPTIPATGQGSAEFLLIFLESRLSTRGPFTPALWAFLLGFSFKGPVV